MSTAIRKPVTKRAFDVTYQIGGHRRVVRMWGFSREHIGQTFDHLEPVKGEVFEGRAGIISVCEVVS